MDVPNLLPLLIGAASLFAAALIGYAVCRRQRPTLRRQAEEALRIKDSAIASSISAIAIADLEGNLTDVNPAFLSLWGYDDESEVLGKPAVGFWQREEEAAEVLEALRDTGSWVGELTARRADSSVFTVQLSASVATDRRSRPICLMVSCIDITERKQTEEALLRYLDGQAALYAVALAATTMLDPHQLLSAVLDEVLPALDADAGWVAATSPARDGPARIVAWRGVPESFVTTRASAGTDQSHLVDDEYFVLPREALASVNLHSHTGIPLRAGDDVLGSLNVAWRAARLYPESDRALLIAIGRQVGLALRNAQLYQTARQVDRLQALNAIGAAAVSSLELNIVLRQILKLACQALDATEGSILLIEPVTEELFFIMTLEDKTSILRGQRLAPGQGIAGWVAHHGQVVCVNDVRQDPRWYDGIDALTGFETRSLLCAPLRHREQITGVIQIVNKRQGEFSADDLRMLEAVSSIAAAALENARLYMSMRSYADELALLNQIGITLTSTLDFSTVVRAALSQVQRLFQAEAVSLLQPDRQTSKLRFVRTVVRVPIGAKPFEIPIELQPGEGIAGWALEHGQPVLVEDTQSDPRQSARVGEYLGDRTHALMAVPLQTRERSIGVIQVTSREPGIYTRNELAVLQAIASTLAVALENAGLYDELKALLRERERAQAQLIHSEKMSALGRLVASIAHEINNPLQAVQTYLTLAQEELALEEDEQQHTKLERYLSTVGDEIERVSAIVRRMRDFYRPAREEVQPTDLHTVLESVLGLANKQLQHGGVTVERAWADQLPEIQANPDHLKQVFLNLLLNAIDAMPSGGTLCISTALDQMQAEGSGEPSRPAVRIEFSDTGEGIPPNTLSRIFEPFFTTKERGTGLGLAISYGIIQAHNGQITVESHEGLGTTFTILLPVEQ
jgi:two-component system NtrC family sensor kinase